MVNIPAFEINSPASRAFVSFGRLVSFAFTTSKAIPGLPSAIPFAITFVSSLLTGIPKSLATLVTDGAVISIIISIGDWFGAGTAPPSLM